VYFGTVICALFIAFVLGVVFAFTMPAWLVIIIQTVLALGLSCCIFKKR